MGNEQKSIRRPACARRGGNPHVPSPTSPSSQVVESVACRLWSSLQEAVPSPVPVPRLLAYAAARIGSAGTRADTTPDYLVQPCGFAYPSAWLLISHHTPGLGTSWHHQPYGPPKTAFCFLVPPPYLKQGRSEQYMAILLSFSHKLRCRQREYDEQEVEVN